MVGEFKPIVDVSDDILTEKTSNECVLTLGWERE